jgi:hypothetical protein
MVGAASYLTSVPTPAVVRMQAMIAKQKAETPRA